MAGAVGTFKRLRIVCIAIVAGVVAMSGASAAVAVDPVIATAGDIACEPSNSHFGSGNGSISYCHQKWTSDLMVNKGLAAVLPLGDNQYICSGAVELAGSYHPTWGRLNAIVRPTPGNHEYYKSGGTGCDASGAAGPYFQYFAGALSTLPASASDPSKGYYSYDIGDWHLIALNTGENCAFVACGAGSAQDVWLKADLAAHTNVCTLAYFHYPRFSSKTPLPAFTQRFWDDLYAGGADVILSGHVHNYERFAPQTPSATADPTYGIREFVVGSGGMSLENFSTTIAANSEFRGKGFGVLNLTLRPTSYSWQFLPDGRNGNTLTDTGTTNCHGVPGQSDTTPPTVSISAPTDGATVSGTTTVSANASDNVAVQSVQFLVDGGPVATDTSAPYSTQLDTTALANGTHTLTARATDTSGLQTTSAPVSVTVSNDTTAPSVSVIAPSDGASLSGTTTLEATASDNVSIASVQFRVDGSVVATDATAPFSGSWNSGSATNGAHTIDAVATDTAGNSTTSAPVSVTVTNTAAPPTVSLTAPTNGATVAGQATVSASASSAAGITSVAFQVDGSTFATDTTAPYSATWSTTTSANGSHTLNAVATAGDSQSTTSADVNVTVNNDTTSPTVSVTAPAAGATVSGTVTLQATAADDTAVQSVQFLVDGVVVNTDASAPYSYAWASGSVPNGSRSITAIARDPSGNQTTSSAVAITVQNTTAAGIARRTSATASGTSGAPTITVPAQVVSGDVVVVAVTTSSSSATFTTAPTGWTKTSSIKAVDFNSAVFTKVAQAGDAGSAVSFPSSSTTDYWTVGLAAYSGVDPTTPIIGATSIAPTTQVQSVAPTAITVPAGSMAVAFASADVSTARTWTEDAGSEVFDVQPTALSLVANDQLYSAAGSASRTLTISGAVQELTGYVIALRPAP